MDIMFTARSHTFEKQSRPNRRLRRPSPAARSSSLPSWPAPAWAGLGCGFWRRAARQAEQQAGNALGGATWQGLG